MEMISQIVMFVVNYQKTIIIQKILLMMKLSIMENVLKESSWFLILTILFPPLLANNQCC